MLRIVSTLEIGELLKKAESNDAWAQNEIGKRYEYGLGVVQNKKQAFSWYEKSALQGHTAGQYHLAWCYEEGIGVEPYRRNALKWYQKAVDKNCEPARQRLEKLVETISKETQTGISSSQNLLGICYEYDWGAIKDEKQAFSWYEKSALQGNANGQTYLATCYEEGIGVERFRYNAVKWYQKAIDQDQEEARSRLKKMIETISKNAQEGDAADQNLLGICYEFGWGVIKDEKQAFSWYEKSALQGNANGQRYLAWCYEEGIGIKQSKFNALKWYQKAVDQNHEPARQYLKKLVETISKEANENNALAQNLLGKCYEYGWGFAKDDEQRFFWYEKAASLGNAHGQYCAGLCYEKGVGTQLNIFAALKMYQNAVDQNYEEAHQRLRNLVETAYKEAQAGEAKCQITLGMCYEHGKGVAKDERQAFFWYEKAATQGLAAGK